MKTQQQREFESRVRKSRGLAHPARPQTGSSGWEMECGRDECHRTFLTPTKQRKYCSPKCQRIVEQSRKRRFDFVSGMLLYTCAAPRCENVFLPDPRNPKHMYCSPHCRQRANRAASDLSPLFCGWCKHPLPWSKSRRRRYCNARCRTYANRAAQRNEN